MSLKINERSMKIYPTNFIRQTHPEVTMFKIKLVATEALNLIAEKISGKKITQLRSEGFDGFSKFLIISKHCLQFDKEVSKLLSKRTLA